MRFSLLQIKKAHEHNPSVVFVDFTMIHGMIASRQVFRLAGHRLPSPSRVFAPVACEGLLSVYGDGLAGEFHPVPYSPVSRLAGTLMRNICMDYYTQNPFMCQ
jgi:hypothetical protein